MVLLKTEDDLILMREGAQILGKAHAEVAKKIQPGISTAELDKIAEEYILDNGGLPSFKGYNGFKHALCISPNEQVVHGIPSDYTLENGDILSVDCGVFYKGFHTDCAYTYGVGDISTDVQNLLKTTKESLYKGIEAAVKGKRIGDVAYAIQSHVEKRGYGIVRELVGHGVGRNLHEAPEVPNYGKQGRGPKLKAGMVIAIEPMINLGKRNIVQESDGWTIRTADKLPSAHFEHTVAILEEGNEILTTHRYIEEVLEELYG